MSLGWPLAPPRGLAHPGHLPSQDNASQERPGGAPLGPPRLRWRWDALQPEVFRGNLAGSTCSHIPDGGFRCVSSNTGRLLGSPSSSQCSRERNHAYFTRLTGDNDVICLQETHGKDEFLQSIQVLVPQFRLFGTFIPSNANAGGSAILIRTSLLPNHALVTHEITCQGRDHIVTTRQLRCDLVMGDLRERLRRISLHWLRCPEASTSASPRKGDSASGIRPSRRVIQGKRPFSATFSRTSSMSRSPSLQGRTPLPTVQYARYPELTEHLLICLWPRREGFTVIFMFLTTLENGPHRVITSQYES